MSNLNTLNFYATPEHPCSYLPNQQATTVFADPNAIISTDVYTRLSQMGFRRSGSHYYRPHCSHCDACKPVRIRLSNFETNRSQRRVLKRNDGITASILPAVYEDDTYRLYESYINARHFDGDMFPANREQFLSFLVDAPESTRFIHFKLNQKLVAVSVTDFLADGLSAVYTFFDSDLADLSLGTFCILWQINHAISHNLPYVYLGYWIKNCHKMNYKAQFKGLEFYNGKEWAPLDTSRT